MKRPLRAALSLLLAALSPLAASAAAVESLAPAVAPIASPTAATALPTAGLSPGFGIPTLALSAPAALTAAPVLSAPDIALDGPGAPAAAAPAGPATIPLVRLARDAGAARAFLASHPDADGVTVERFQDALRRIYLTAPSGPGSSRTLALVALQERARRASADAETRALARVMEDIPRLAAEGMIRARVGVPAARELDARQRGWDRDATGRPIADVAVIGAGPAGLATGLHAAHAGLKTVVFEAGYAAQSFSDAAMKPVYRMRTPSTRNSLAQAPFSPPELVADAGLTARLAEYRSAGQAADSALYAKTRAPPILGARAGLDANDPAIASARNELLQHFAAAADAIAARGGIVAERSRVESAAKDDDGLWTLVVNGRVQRARKLVLAQGQVGVDVEHAGFPPDLQRAALRARLNALTIKDYVDLQEAGPALAEMTRALSSGQAPERRLLINDALLGSPAIERAFRLLAPGTRVMITGSGESAVKAAVAVLRLNKKIKVDLFVKDRLQSAQLQIPAAHASPDAIARALADPAVAKKTLHEWEAIGTPVTPATLADLEALKQAGRLRIIPLGKKCIAAAIGDPDPAHTIEIARARSGDRATIRVYAVDPDVIAHLRAEGIGGVDPQTGRWLISSIDGPIISAVGYSRPSLREDPLTTMLTAQGRLVPTRGETKATAHEFELSGLRSAGDPDLYLVGAQNVTMSADSAIPGAVARAASLVNDIAESLRRKPWYRLLAAVFHGPAPRRG